MKTTINGITFENVTVEEALQLLRSSQTKQKTESMVETRVKRHYTKRKTSPATKAKVWWTNDEIEYILTHPEMKPKELHKEIPRHSQMAISVMSSAIRSGQPKKAGKYVQKLVNAFYNKGFSRPVNIPVHTNA